MRIKVEHPDDPQAVFNDRVKGQLKVTRAFGAGFLKKVSSYDLACLTDNLSYLSMSNNYVTMSVVFHFFYHAEV